MALPKILQWALETVFPGSGPTPPWAGQPCKVAPIGDLFTPDTPIDSGNMNYLFNALGTNAQGAIDLACLAALNEWCTPVTDPAGSGFTLVHDTKWDFANQRWISASDDSGTVKLATSVDNGATWQLLGSGSVTATSATAVALSVNPSNGNTVIASTVTGSGNTVLVTGTSYGAPNLVSQLNGITYATGEFFGSLYHLFSGVQSGGSFTGTWLTSPDGSTWTARTLPSGWASGTDHIGSVLTAYDNSHAALGMLVAQCGVTAGTSGDTCRLGLVTAGSPTTMADVTPSTALGVNLPIITGLAYSAYLGLFGLLIWDAFAGNSKLLTTPTPSDPTSWTLVKTFTGLRCDGLASVGEVWVAGSVASSVRRLVTSTDPTATLSWSYSPGLPQSWSESGVPKMIPGGTTQSVAMFNAANVTVSGQVGALPGVI